MSGRRLRTLPAAGDRDQDMRPAQQSNLIAEVEVIAICAVAFLADIMSGILGATFSLYAENLGATVVFIGLLTSMTGLVGLVARCRWGRLRSGRAHPGAHLRHGRFCALDGALRSCAGPGIPHPGRLLLGAAMVASFWIAAAYLGDIVTSDRTRAGVRVVHDVDGAGFRRRPVGGRARRRMDRYPRRLRARRTRRRGGRRRSGVRPARPPTSDESSVSTADIDPGELAGRREAG